MIKSGLSKRVVIFSSLSFIIIMGVIISTLVSNSKIRTVIATRDTRLDVYEATKLWVIDDMRTYLTISDEKSYTDVKRNVHMTPDLKNSLFKSDFSSFSPTGIKEVSFVDAQYSLDDKGNFMVYLLANVKGDKTKELNFLVSVNNNKIYDVIAY